MREAFLRKYSENLRQLGEIVELQEEFNRTCAQQSLTTQMSLDTIEKFSALTRTAFDELKNLPSWKLFLRYPRYWYLAEAHAKYFAPSETQLRVAIKEVGQTAAP